MTHALRERRASIGRAEGVRQRLHAVSSEAPAAQRRIWVPVLAVWAVSRVFFFVFGAVGHELVRQAHVRGVYPEPLGSLSYWAHWDGRWLAHIATNGYDTDAATAFFPLYPLVLRVGAETGVGVAMIGVAISSLATLAALYFVFALGQAWYGERAALAAIVTLAFFPTAFYLNAVYTDPLFLALTAGALWALYVRRRLLLAGAFAALAALTRNIGGLLVLALAYEWVRNRREFGWTGLAGVAGPIAGVVAYALYLWERSGNPLLFSQAYEQNWERSFGNPLITLRDGFAHAHDGVSYLVPSRVLETASTLPATLLSNTLNFCFLGFACLTLILAARRVPPGVLLYAVPAALAPLALTDARGLPLISYPRYVLVVFPLFLALAAVLARSRLALVAWTVASATLGAYLTILFASWRWVA
jgi:hypothetical protein